MKTFTFNDIKEFCKTHYREYLGEVEVSIVFSFLDKGLRRTITFLELAVGMELDLGGMWQYVGCGDFGENKYMFNFKRIA